MVPWAFISEKMTFYTPTKTFREAGCASPKLKITEMSNSEQMMEPRACTDHKAHPEAERNERWRLDNMDGSQRPHAEWEWLSKHCAQHESARGGLQMTEAGVQGRDQWLSADRNSRESGLHRSVFSSWWCVWQSVHVTNDRAICTRYQNQLPGMAWPRDSGEGIRGWLLCAVF